MLCELHEEPYVWVLKWKTSSRSPVKTVCSYCCRKYKHVSPCQKCNFISYCSEECKSSDAFYHKLECQAIASCQTAAYRDRHARLIGRIILRRASDQGILGESDWYGVQARSLSDLMSHEEDIRGSAYWEGDFQIIWAKFKELYNSVPSVVSLTNESDCRRIYGTIITNVFSICRHKLNIGSTSIGTGLYFNCSRFDHSCDPDLIYHHDGRKLIMVTPDRSPINLKSKSINELTTKYIGTGIDQFGVASTEERQQLLRDTYWFTCQCHFCTDTNRDLIMRNSIKLPCSKCQNRTGNSVLVVSGSKLKCIGSSCPYEIENAQLCKKVLATIERIKKEASAMANFEDESSSSNSSSTHHERNKDQFIKRCEKSSKLASEVLHPKYNIFLIRGHECFLDYYINKCFEEHEDKEMEKAKESALAAISYGKKCIEAYDTYYPVKSLWQGAFHYNMAKVYERVLNDYKSAMESMIKAKEIWKMQLTEKHLCVQKLNLKMIKLTQQSQGGENKLKAVKVTI